MLWFLFIVSPVLAIGGSLWLWFKKSRTGLGFGYLAAVVSGLIFSWSILQSRGSTASIGLLFVPAYACICGILVWAFFRLKSKQTVLKIIGFLCLFSSFALVGYAVYAGLKEKRLVTENEKELREIQSQRQWIAEQVSKDPDNKETWLNSQVKSRINESAFVRAALFEPYLGIESLKDLSKSSNILILVAVINHKNATPELLQSIFDRHADTNKLDVAFAMNSATPTTVLESVYLRSQFISFWLADNLNLNQTILNKLALEKNLDVINKVVSHPKTDCEGLKISLSTVSNLPENGNQSAAELTPKIIQAKIQNKMSANCDR